MKAQDTRLKKLEQQVPASERQFIGWVGDPWTPEEEAEAIRQNPDQRIFYRSLLYTREERLKLEQERKALDA